MSFKNFFEKAFGHFGIYYIKNKNLSKKVRQMYVYNRMKKRYNYIIEKGVDVSDTPESSDNIWICWFQGEEKMPELIKACLNSVRQNLPDKTIIILTDNNINEYIHFPSYIIEKRNKGIITHAHYSDLIRTELMCNYGGLWLDATVLCTSKDVPKSIFNSDFFVYKAFDLLKHDINYIVSSSWLIYSKSNQKIMLLTRKLLYEYWKTEEKLSDYFLFHIFFAISTQRYRNEWDAIPLFNNHSPHTLQLEFNKKYSEERWNEICGMSCFHKLNHHIDYSKTGDSFYKHVLVKYLYYR